MGRERRGWDSAVPSPARGDQRPRTSRGNPDEEKQQRRRGHRAVPFSTRLVLDVK